MSEYAMDGRAYADGKDRYMFYKFSMGFENHLPVRPNWISRLWADADDVECVPLINYSSFK